ncbi:MAG: dolichyl-phosphate beta-glucosyltransferase, partial [Myxococcota bacterium]
MTDLANSRSAGVESRPSRLSAPGSSYVLDIVIPVYNEERDLPGSVRRLHQFLATEVPYAARITVADNASTDSTLDVARRLAEELPHVDVIHLDAKGRGGALRAAWTSSTAEVVAYMDVDLSTDLTALMPLVAPLVSGHSDVAIGSRLSASSRVIRGPKREFVSRSYNLILRSMLGAHFSDAQCGFKAVRADVARQLLPLVVDTGWFFDTELLVIAERAGLRIHEVPVDWIDDPDSRVDVVRTAIDDLKGCWRVGRALATGALPLCELQAALGREPLVPGVPKGMVGQLVRFGIVGVASTLAYALLYLVLHPALGAQAANLVALLVTAVANT